MLSPISYNSPAFGANLKSPVLKYSCEDFFIRIRGYGKDYNWAEKIKETADEAVDLIRGRWDADWVLFSITQGVKEANQYPLDLQKRIHTGILRTEREGWEYDCNDSDYELGTNYGVEGHYKYRVYEKRLDEVMRHPLNNPIDGIELTRPKIGLFEEKYLSHANAEFINKALRHVEQIYNLLQKYYIPIDVKKEDLKFINDAIAQIRWIMAHATPWERGSDAISNVFMRAIYKSMGIKTYKPAKGISFDMEAFCTNLNDYKKNFTKFFEKPPRIVE